MAKNEQSLTNKTTAVSGSMRSKAQVLVFIPTLNDKELVAGLAAQVIALGDYFIPLIIDDGSRIRLSSDELPDQCLLFSLPDNMGLGVCTHIAIDHALAHGYSEIVRFEADGQNPVDVIPKLLAQLWSGEADLVAGLRVNHHGAFSPDNMLRRFVKAYVRALASLATHGKAPGDVNSGFFAANRLAMTKINNNQLERYPEPQMFIISCNSGLRVREMPFHQVARMHGNSTLNYAEGARMFYRISIFVLSEIFRKNS